MHGPLIPFRRAVPLSLVVVIGILGCTSQGELTAEELVTEGNRICVESRERINDIERPDSLNAQPSALTPQQREDYLVYINRVIDAYETRLDRFEDIDPPDELESQWVALESSVNQVIAASAVVQAAVEAGNDTMLDGAQDESRAAVSNMLAAGEALGLQECATTG